MVSMVSPEIETVTVSIRLYGWLATYFPASEITVTTVRDIGTALPQIISDVMKKSHSDVPDGGMMIMVNDRNAQRLIKQKYQLRNDDIISFIPVVAGG